jgi:Lecithin:cholesterol acyltransferase
MTSTVMIFLPGTTGSTLVSDKNNYDNTLDPIWPAQVETAALGRLDGLALTEIEGTLYPGIPRTGYTSFFNFFTQLGFTYANYTDPAGLPAPPPQNLLLGLAYDWRQDNSTSAIYLRGALQIIDAAYGNDYQVFLVAHSMGGLVCRAYLESDISANDPWRSNIKALVTLGTPHLGAPLAVLGIEGELNEISSKVPPSLDTVVQSFVDKSFSDSTYELLPPPNIPFISYQNTEYSIFAPDLPAVVTAAINGLSQADLKDAQSFFASLTNQSNLPPYYCIYGLTNVQQQATVIGFVYDADPSALTPQPSQAGDWIVPQSSASFAGREVAALYNPPGNVNHLQLPGDPNVQQQVAQWMGLSTAALRTAA